MDKHEVTMEKIEAYVKEEASYFNHQKFMVDKLEHGTTAHLE